MGLGLAVTIMITMVTMIVKEVRWINSEERRAQTEREIREIKAKRYILETEKMKREMLR